MLNMFDVKLKEDCMKDDGMYNFALYLEELAKEDISNFGSLSRDKKKEEITKVFLREFPNEIYSAVNV